MSVKSTTIAAGEAASSATEREIIGRKINHLIGRAIVEYQMIREGERILVAVSGGKDSLCLLHFLQDFQKKAPVRFEILAVNLDQGQPGFPADVLPRLFADWDVPHHIEFQDTYSIVLEKTKEGGTYCALCSRLRRGVLYRIAREKGCSRIALGHHRDDLLQTFLMNALFSGKLGTMPPIYTVAEGDLQVIRPLYAVPEDILARYAALSSWPIVPCNLCGSQEGLKRKEAAALLESLEAKNPGVKASLFGAMGNPHLDELLNASLWTGTRAVREPEAIQNGDTKAPA